MMKVECWRSVKDKVTRQVRYAITSLGTHTSAGRLLQLIRGHWRIENGLHYVRDVTMGEDGSQVRTGSALSAAAKPSKTPPKSAPRPPLDSLPNHSLEPADEERAS